MTILLSFSLLLSFSFLFFAYVFLYTQRDRERERERKKKRKKKGRSNFRRCVYSGLRRGRTMGGRKEEREKQECCAHRYKFVHDGWTDSLPPSFPSVVPALWRTVAKKKGLDSLKGLSLSLSSCFLLRVVYRYYTRMQNVFRLLLTQVSAFESNSLGNEENLVCAFSPFPFSFVISSILYRNETRTGEIM